MISFEFIWGQKIMQNKNKLGVQEILYIFY